jgi:RNA polymerase sigma-70 factor (ECF subfamily)
VKAPPTQGHAYAPRESRTNPNGRAPLDHSPSSIHGRPVVKDGENLSRKGGAVEHAQATWSPLIADRWLVAFHAGDRAAVAQCYRDHAKTVASAVGRMLSAADSETVTHEVFYRLLSDAGLRANFRGGNFSTWITRVATNGAIDYLRRCRREQSGLLGAFEPDVDARAAARRVDEELDAKVLVERFCRDHLPSEWAGVFDARFIRQVTQRDAAKELGIRRTTLAYRELRIRRLLTRFLLRAEHP